VVTSLSRQLSSSLLHYRSHGIRLMAARTANFASSRFALSLIFLDVCLLRRRYQESSTVTISTRLRLILLRRRTNRFSCRLPYRYHSYFSRACRWNLISFHVNAINVRLPALHKSYASKVIDTSTSCNAAATLSVSYIPK